MRRPLCEDAGAILVRKPSEAIHRVIERVEALFDPASIIDNDDRIALSADRPFHPFGMQPMSARSWAGATSLDRLMELLCSECHAVRRQRRPTSTDAALTSKVADAGALKRRHIFCIVGRCRYWVVREPSVAAITAFLNCMLVSSFMMAVPSSASTCKNGVLLADR